MSWDQIKKTLENCEKMCQTFGLLPYMYITGGDPVLHKDFWQLAELLKYATIIISSLPLLIMYPFFQKYFDSGIMAGAVKG